LAAPIRRIAATLSLLTPAVRRSARFAISLGVSVAAVTVAFVASDRVPPPEWTNVVFWPEVLLNVPIRALPFSSGGAIATVFIVASCLVGTVLFWASALFALLGALYPQKKPSP
jgi:hypothetical protein